MTMNISPTLPDALIPGTVEEYLKLSLSKMINLSWATRGIERDEMEKMSYAPLWEDKARHLESENLRLRSALEQAQAQVAELRGAAGKLLGLIDDWWENNAPPYSAIAPLMEELRNALASDGSELLEVVKAAEEVAAQYNSAFIGAYKDGWIQELLDIAKELTGALAAWRGEKTQNA